MTILDISEHENRASIRSLHALADFQIGLAHAHQAAKFFGGELAVRNYSPYVSLGALPPDGDLIDSPVAASSGAHLNLWCSSTGTPSALKRRSDRFEPQAQ